MRHLCLLRLHYGSAERGGKVQEFQKRLLDHGGTPRIWRVPPLVHAETMNLCVVFAEGIAAAEIRCKEIKTDVPTRRLAGYVQ